MHSALRCNAFRPLSLSADADGKKVYRQQDRLQIRLQVETANQDAEYRFVHALPVTQEDLLDALHRIENQSNRQLEELFWIHELEDISTSRRRCDSDG